MRPALLLLALILTACTSAAGPEPSPAATQPPPAELLPGEDWVLLASPAAGRTTLRVEDGRFSGQAPVNRYSGSLQIDGERLTLSAVASTKMAGPPEPMAAEVEYFQTLPKVTTWEVMDEQLTLSGPDGPLLVYAAPDSTGAFAVTLLGSSPAKAKAQAEKAGYAFRVVSVDGEPRAVTMDFRSDRIGATVVDGRVTEVAVG